MSEWESYEYDWSRVSKWKGLRIRWQVRATRLPGLLWRLAVAPLVYLVVVALCYFIAAVVRWLREWWSLQPYTEL